VRASTSRHAFAYLDFRAGHHDDHNYFWSHRRVISMNHADSVVDASSPSETPSQSYPELLVDLEAADGRYIILADEFGQQIRLSPDQLLVLASAIESGVLDPVLQPLIP
jgi:hypothetical protein